MVEFLKNKQLTSHPRPEECIFFSFFFFFFLFYTTRAIYNYKSKIVCSLVFDGSNFSFHHYLAVPGDTECWLGANRRCFSASRPHRVCNPTLNSISFTIVQRDWNIGQSASFSLSRANYSIFLSISYDSVN